MAPLRLREDRLYTVLQSIASSCRMRNQVQLITYVDRLAGGGLRELQEVLCGALAGAFGGVHLLPFYDPIDRADAGFDPVDHTRVDPRLGTWADVRALSTQLEVMADVIVNHVSSDCAQFHDFLARGEDSPYAGLFVTFDSVFAAGASEADLIALYRPRPGLPFTAITLADGRRRLMWTTFSPQQIDIDVANPLGVAYLHAILDALARNGVTIIRLDAVGYAVKRAGSSCFLLPQTYEFIDRLSARAHAAGMEVVAEVHAYFRDQVEIAKRVDRVYDFQLPPLVLHAFAFRTSRYLKQWIEIRPNNALTVLDTHDGLGIIDIAADGPQRPGLVPAEDLLRLIELIHERTRGASRLASGWGASNVDSYQINTTFYDAMGGEDRAYLLARAIQFFLPGIPQVYYVGLLAGRNDLDLLARTRVGRDINRHYYTRHELAEALGRRVVVALLELIHLRNAHPAFNGYFSLGETPDAALELRWVKGPDFAHLYIDFQSLRYTLRYSSAAGVREMQLP
jgi:sucrose phosphorylase